jgi:hypothetical protein
MVGHVMPSLRPIFHVSTLVVLVPGISHAHVRSSLLAKHFQMKSHELILKPAGVKASKEDVLNTEMSHLSCIHTPDRNIMY